MFCWTWTKRVLITLSNILIFVTNCNIRKHESLALAFLCTWLPNHYISIFYIYLMKSFAFLFSSDPCIFFNKAEIIMKIEFHLSLMNWIFYLHQRKKICIWGIWGSYYSVSVFCHRDYISLFFYCIFIWNL